MSAEGKATIPHPAVTICNTLWGSALTFSPFSVAAGATGDAPKPVSFDRLFPEEQSLVETCREAGLEREPLQLCSLLLGSSSYRALALLLKNGVLSVSQPLSSEQATLPHLACALGLPPAINAIRDTLNGSTNSSFVWSIKDGEGRIPEEVCFNSELVKKLPHRPLFGRKKNNSSLPRPPNDSHRRATFQLAKEPENFYSLIVALRSSQFNVDSERDENGDLLIHTAVHGGIPSLPLLLSLLNHFKADVNARDGSGATPLALACRLGHSRVAEVLVCVGGADMGSRESDRGTTALHSAALGGHPDVVRMLLRRGADAAAEDEQGCDAGFLAKRAGHHECRQIIVQHSRGRFTSLAAQTITGSLDIAMVRRADVCQVTEDGSTLLNLAAKHGHAHLLSQLVKFETCPLDYRQMKIPDLLDTSMELSANLRDLPESGEHPFKSALHFAAQGGYLQCVQILLDAHTHPSLPDCDGWLPLHHACDSEHVDIVRLLLKYPSTLVLSGLRPAMNLAEGRCNNDIITLLEEAMLRRQNEIMTPTLFDAAVSGNADLLFTILENGDDINPLKEESCDWPLLLAAGFGYLEIVEHLYKFGGHVTRANPKTGNTPLHVAARGGQENVVSYLLTFTRQAGTSREGEEEGEGGERERGRDINCRNKSGATPLELTVAQGHNSIVQLLLDSGASCCLPDSNGQLLTCAEFAGIQFILETYRRERVQIICGALERAATLEEFQTIWQGPWDYNLRAESGDTVLMVAAQHAPLKVVRFLLTEASSAPPTVLVAGGIPTPSPGRRMVCSPDDSEHTMSDAHPSFTPGASRKDYVDSWDPERPASVVPFHISPGRRRRRHTGIRRSYNRFPVQRSSNRAPSPLRVGPRRSGPSGASNASSGEDDGGKGVLDAAGSEPSIASNPGICTTIIRATNPHDGQTAAHRAALTGKQENLSLLLHYDPECVLAKDLAGDTPLHLACRGTQKKAYRKIVEMLLGCDRVVASVMNKKGQRPEDDCPNTKTRKLVIKKRTKETLDLPSVPDTDPRKNMFLSQISEGASSTTSKPLTHNEFEERLRQMKEEHMNKSSTSEHDTSN